MKTTLLHPWHEAAGARFAPFASYDMPIQYPTGAIEEHRLTRRSVGLFDIDHMGQVMIWGPGAGEALSQLVSNRILDMKGGDARYALLLNEAGGVIDDLFIYRLEPSTTMVDPWFIVVNASNRETDLAHFKNNLASPVQVQDISDETYMIALQGPQAVSLLDNLTKGSLSATARFTMTEVHIDGVPCKMGRTGYTGEDGAELFYPAEKAVHIWEYLLYSAKKQGIEAGPIGLAARDSLRFEAGMPLHGHEISPHITPLEALLSWACDFEKDFVGKQALLQQKAQGLSRKLVTITVKGGVPREGYTVLDREGRQIGNCVAGMYCPTTETYSANAFVEPAFAKVGTEVAVAIRGSAKPAVVVQRPLYVPTYRRNK